MGTMAAEVAVGIAPAERVAKRDSVLMDLASPIAWVWNAETMVVEESVGSALKITSVIPTLVFFRVRPTA